MRLLLVFCAALSLNAEIAGTLQNASTGKPQPNAVVKAIGATAQGMQTLGSAKTDAQGVFKMDLNVDQPVLLQSEVDSVTYSMMLAPGTPSTGVKFNVYQTSADPKTASVSQHMVLLQPTGSDLQVAETFLFDNKSKFTLNDPKNGSLRFYLPQGAEAQVTIQGPGGVPIQRPAEKTGQPNVYKVNYAVRPGETRFDVTYTLPWKQPLVYEGRSVMGAGETRLIVPSGVTIAGDKVEQLGQEPTTQANIFSTKLATYKVEITGTGALRQPGGEEQQQQQENNGPTIEQILPRIYNRLYWIMGISAAILAAGGALLYRKQAS
jgi:hypothetical protein